MFNHIIYVLIDPITLLMHYLGYTSDARTRFNTHMSNKQGTKEKRLWISRLKKQGLKPIMRTIAVYPNAEMLPKQEHVWYDAFVANGEELYNDPAWIGAGRRKGSKSSKEALEKKSATMKKMWASGEFKGPTGKRQTEESNKKRSKAMKTVELPQRFKDGHITWNRGKNYRTISDEQVNEIRRLQQEGLSQRAISKITGMGRSTIRKYGDRALSGAEHKNHD